MRRKLLIGLGAGVPAVILVAAAWFGYAIFADTSRPAQTTRVIVARGSTFRDIAAQLAQAGVIGNPTAFRFYAKLRHADTDAHAGEFRFAPRRSAAFVLSQLQSGGAQIARWVTIPEGYTAKQIAQRLAREGFGDWRAYDAAFMRDSIVIDGRRTKNLEGFLFPSTYLIPIGATPEAVEQIMTAEFYRELPRDAASKARAHGLTLAQAVTVASLIEREAKSDDERALMAGVYYNRLRIDMPLEVDASLEYAFARHKDVITYRDLKTDSPYNTYEHKGLPPTPIANPGEPSLIAALNPKPSDYLYYVYKGDGHHAFAKTLAQQTANIARYLK